VGYARDIIRDFAAFLYFVANVHVAKHVDIDGIQQEPGQSPAHELYMQTVIKARGLVRALEAAVQAIYDDSASLLVAAQGLRAVEAGRARQEYVLSCRRLSSLAHTLEANAGVVLQTLEALVRVGLDQARTAGGDYRQSIDWRASRRSMIESGLRSIVTPNAPSSLQHDEVVDMEHAFGVKSLPRVPQYEAYSSGDRSPMEEMAPTPTWNAPERPADSLLDDNQTTMIDEEIEEDECSSHVLRCCTFADITRS
jgi:son of sevenless-like protein